MNRAAAGGGGGGTRAVAPAPCLDDVAKVGAVGGDVGGLQVVNLQAGGGPESLSGRGAAAAAPVRLHMLGILARQHAARACFSSLAMSPAMTSRRCPKASSAGLEVLGGALDMAAADQRCGAPGAALMLLGGGPPAGRRSGGAFRGPPLARRQSRPFCNASHFNATA